MRPSLCPENLEKLFLFEVYIESLKIDYPKLCLTKSCLDTLKETVIQCQFLGFNPIEIKEEEFTKIPEKSKSCDKQIMTGKSCLFSLRDMPKDIRCLEVGIKVSRVTDSGTCLKLGTTSIRLGDNFANIFKAPKQNVASATVKKPFALFDKNCREIGRICVSINLSCFGKMITTSFQLDGEDSKSYVVQPGGEVPMSDFLLKNDESIDRGVCPGEYPFGRLLGGAALRQDHIMPPMSKYQMAGYPPMTGAGVQTQGLLGGMSPRGQGGNRPMSPSRPSPPSSSSSDDHPPPPMPALNFCSCDYPIPPQFLQSPQPPKKKKKKKNPCCPLGLKNNFCVNPGCPMGFPALPVVEERHQVCQAMELPPGTIGLKGEQMVFQMPQENQPLPGNRKARFKFGGGVDNNLNDVRILKDGETKKNTLPDHLNDIYIMKVGKTNQENEQRHKMVLEVKQPRPPRDDRMPRDIRTQYLETDFKPEEPKKKEKKGKGKGKKGKGKGKGKGKKGKK